MVSLERQPSGLHARLARRARSGHRSHAAVGGRGELVAFLASAFDAYYEAAATHPLIMNYGMHPPVSGRPDTFAGLRGLVEHIRKHDDVWICTHDELAAWWNDRFRSLVPPDGGDVDLGVAV